VQGYDFDPWGTYVKFLPKAWNLSIVTELLKLKDGGKLLVLESSCPFLDVGELQGHLVFGKRRSRANITSFLQV
jgi:hypothetical protein